MKRASMDAVNRTNRTEFNVKMMVPMLCQAMERMGESRRVGELLCRRYSA